MRTRMLVAAVVVALLGLGWTVPAHAGDNGVTAQEQQNDLLTRIRHFRQKHDRRRVDIDSILQREAKIHSGELAAHDEDDFSDFSSHVHDIQKDRKVFSDEICGVVSRIGGIPTEVGKRLFDDMVSSAAGRACILDNLGYRANSIGLSVKFNNTRFYATLILARVR